MNSTCYHVRVTKDFLVFSSGHFITYNGKNCEPVHGHNYRVAVEVEDDLDENHYVYDFIALRDHSKAIVDTLDHRMLLPGSNPWIKLADDGTNWLVRYEERYWSFPKDECVVLNIPNTTAERLAEQIGERLLAAFAANQQRQPKVLRVEVEECFGQSATITIKTS